MHNIRIDNIRTYKPCSNEISIKIDRSTPLGNPYYMKDGTERDYVCDKYAAYLAASCDSNADIARELNRIADALTRSDVVLLCWCYPKRCHGEEIIKLIKEKIS